MSDGAVKLNLGAGDTELEGFIPIDKKIGKEVYPLDYADGTVEEIYASHVLEHFSHNGQVAAVLKHWVDKLEPGGRIRIAVPDFEWIAREYGAGVPIDSQGYTMGGHTDTSDIHGCLFDRESLTEIMVNAGLERIGEWKAEIQDCSALPVSLNLQGFKPSGAQKRPEGVFGVISTPRYGPIMHMQCSFKALATLGISNLAGQGAYWGQVLSECIETLLAEQPTCRYILTMDYDTIFGREDVLELYRLMEACLEYDALCPVQSRRSSKAALFGMVDENDKARTQIYAGEFAKHITPIKTGHFGLTMIRVSSLLKLPRPWMMATPNKKGRWTDGKVDADIKFWHNWKAAGFKLGLANKVVIGHIEELIVWPDDQFQPVYQKPSDYNEAGIPKEVRRCHG